MNNTKLINFLPKLGFAITLFSLSLSINGFQRILDYILTGIIAFVAVVLLFEDKSSKPIWKSIVIFSKDLDMPYVAFGLGLMLVSSKFSNIVWASLLLLIAGIVFSSIGIAKLIGTGFLGILKTDAKIGIAYGCFWLIVGLLLIALTWNSILEKPLINVPTPILIIGLGIIFIYFGHKKWRKSRVNTPI